MTADRRELWYALAAALVAGAALAVIVNYPSAPSQADIIQSECERQFSDANQVNECFVRKSLKRLKDDDETLDAIENAKRFK